MARKRMLATAATAAFLFVLASAAAGMEAKRTGRAPGPGATAADGAGTGTAAVEGQPASCFWEGPISTRVSTTRGFDGRNFNFPEESATYWLARLNLPDGARLELRGRFPHARYMSINAYSDGTPTDALSDVAIAPRPGHGNPFRAGAKRERRQRSWTVAVVDSPPPQSAAERTPNTLYAQPATGAAIELVYRVYEPDPGRGLTAGARLPRPIVLLPGGERLRKEQACAAVNDRNREIATDTVPAELWRAGRSSPGCDPDTHPAHDPIRWERFFNVEYASLAVVTDCTEPGRGSRHAIEPELRGGFYSNRDSAYVYAHLAREFGPLVVVEGRLPTFPRTDRQPKRMPRGQVRFWSLCSGESRVTVRTPDCLADRQVLRRSGRRFTIVVSRRADRPRNARARCGVAWLDWGKRGDGAGDPDYGLLILRNMLASPGFTNAIQRIERPGDERGVMGPYFPDSTYSTVEGFEARGCKRSR